MVVKPDPLDETPQIRTKLAGIADFAANQEGKSHYRFFCYTDPTIGLTDKAPNGAKWAAGTFPAVCSSLIWMSIRQSNEKIEGALEPADLDGGAQIALKTPDGLYVYDADERLASGEVLFNRLHLMVVQQVGGFIEFLTDAADDISNQILNTFASDWADWAAKDSEKWRQTTDANAVSPQNLMFYDSPLYGFSEPLIFRDARVEDVVIHKWKKVAQTGTIKGVVKFQGKPVQGVNVLLSVSQATANRRPDFLTRRVPLASGSARQCSSRAMATERDRQFHPIAADRTGSKCHPIKFRGVRRAPKADCRRLGCSWGTR
jgi:hypothetical protein